EGLHGTPSVESCARRWRRPHQRALCRHSCFSYPTELMARRTVGRDVLLSAGVDLARAAQSWTWAARPRAVSAAEGLGQLSRVTCRDQPVGCGVVGIVDVDAHRVLRPGTDLEEGAGVEIDSASLLRRLAFVSGRCRDELPVDVGFA